jgi:Bacterial SH3 domain
MEVGDFTEIRPNGNRSTENIDRANEIWAPALAPTETFAGDNLLGQEAFDPSLDEDRSFWRTEQSAAQIHGSFEPRRRLIASTLIASTVIVAALAVGVLAFFWTAAGEKTAAQPTATQPTEAAPIVHPVQSSDVTPLPASAKMREPAPEPPAAVAWDLPASITAQGASAASTGNTVPSRNVDTVFLQRPGVNIRATPSATGIVRGSAPKGTRFKITNRDGKWVQVEGGRLKGWITSQFLAANKPQ